VLTKGLFYCRDGDSTDESKYSQWFAEYTITNFVQIAMQYAGEEVEVKVTSMFIGAASCAGLMEFGSSDIVHCPANLPLGKFPMPLEGSTRFVRNLDWAVVGRKVYLFGEMNGKGASLQVCALFACVYSR
jgi:hypothetical protein